MTFTEPWPSILPEINALRYELGTGPGSWEAASAIWTQFAGLMGASIASLGLEVATMTGVTLTGMTSVAMAAESVPFLGWMFGMEALALANAAACQTVAMAWGTTMAGLIPSPVVTANRVAEANAEATNFFGINTPLIAELNREYGQFWTQNATSMMTWDQAVTLATIPKMAPPPPPLAHMGSTGAQALEAGANAAQTMSSAGQSMSQATDAFSQSTQATGSGGNGMEMISSLMSPAQSLMQAPQQLFQQAGQQFGQIGQQFQSLLGQFAGGPQFGNELGNAFTPMGLHSPSGGMPLTQGGGGGGLGMGGGGGIGAGGFGNMGNMSGNGSRVQNVSNISGVPSPGIGSGNKVTAMNQGMGGGPMGGMGGHGGNAGTSSRKVETVLAADTDDGVFGRTDSREERRMFG